MDTVLIIQSSVIACPGTEVREITCPHIRDIGISYSIGKREMNAAEMRFFGSCGRYDNRGGRSSGIVYTRLLSDEELSCDS